MTNLVRAGCLFLIVVLGSAPFAFAVRGDDPAPAAPPAAPAPAAAAPAAPAAAGSSLDAAVADFQRRNSEWATRVAARFVPATLADYRAELVLHPGEARRLSKAWSRGTPRHEVRIVDVQAPEGVSVELLPGCVTNLYHVRINYILRANAKVPAGDHAVVIRVGLQDQGDASPSEVLEIPQKLTVSRPAPGADDVVLAYLAYGHFVARAKDAEAREAKLVDMVRTASSAPSADLGRQHAQVVQELADAWLGQDLARERLQFARDAGEAAAKDLATAALSALETDGR